MKTKILTTALGFALASYQGFAITNAVSISEGGRFGLAQLTDGTLKSWGEGIDGEGANNQFSVINWSPVTVLNSSTNTLTNIQAYSAGGAHALALRSNSTVVAWGYNAATQLGLADANDRKLAVTIPALTNITGIAAGGAHSLAISNGFLYAWGQNKWGQCGIGSTSAVAGVFAPDHTNVPTRVPGLSNVVSIAAGTYCSAALLSDGSLYTWGGNAYGELGNGATGDTNVPQLVVGLTGASNVAIGQYHMLAISNKYAYAWGNGGYGQLGNGTYTDTNTLPLLVSDVAAYDYETNTIPTNEVVATRVTNVTAVTYTNILVVNGDCLEYSNAVDQIYTAVFTNYCTNYYDITNVTFTRSMQGHVIQVAASWKISLALTDDGRVWSWGVNVLGQLGIDNSNLTYSTNVPIPVVIGGTTPLTDVKAISIGSATDTYSCTALLKDGTVVTWGNNADGELGTGSSTPSYSIVPVNTAN